MKTRDTLRAEERRARRTRVSAATLPALTQEAVDAALESVRAHGGIGLRDLDEHLVAHPDALTSGDARCPAVIVRLARRLAGNSHPSVVVPACSDCGRAGVGLPRRGPDGRVCQACSARSPQNKKPCARCGRIARIAARRDEGGICLPCYRTDPQVVEECAGCGRIRMPVTRRADGRPLCENCWTPPAHICTACGRVGRAQSLGPTGALCPTCYRRLAQPRRTCGNCGRHQQIVRKATADSPDLCWNCATPPAAPCSVCDEVRPCTKNADGELLCRTCRPRATSPCSDCGRTRPVHAHWPRGSVCGACYIRVLDHPGRCHRCGNRQPLIGRDDEGQICGPCAGLPDIYICPTCGKGGRLYADGRCPRCLLPTRLTEHLRGPDGHVSAQLQPLRDALAAADDARGVLCWLRRSPNARLLGELAATGRPLSHDLLDELPPSRYEHYVRQTLVHTGVLPERHEELDRIPAWLDRLLADRPPHHATLVRPFTHWFLLKRARRRAAQRKHPATAASFLRTRIRVALDLLTWLDTHELALEELTQDHLEQWLMAGNTRHYTVRYFLDWAATRGIARPLTVPTIARRHPSRILDEDERWTQLRRCLNDIELPLDVRAAGALVLLFGLPTSRIRQLHVEHLREKDGMTSLDIGSPPLLIPPKLAALLHRLARSPVRESRFTGDGSGPRWLFPGLLPGRPAGPSGFSRKLLDQGIDARPARNAALVALVEHIPPAVLADLLGLHITTAVRWAEIARRDWTHYLAARDLDLDRIEAERDRRSPRNTAPSE
ncbi:XRE family transcriptional regulator [Embleya sp. MST-111070]|uniref:XRE family transcriptional regulator n=1 Tax=Embleya sp. MST-111070 TaxID=3398231 RepID=UPI003F73FBEC